MGVWIHAVVGENVFKKENSRTIPQKSVRNDNSRVGTYEAEANRYQLQFKANSKLPFLTCLL